MTTPKEPSGARRASLLTRVLRLVDQRGDRRGADHPPLPVASLQTRSSLTSANHDTAPLPAVEIPLYLEARRRIKERAWGRAQRALEEVTRLDPESPAPTDLQSVRTIRRALRRTARWPSDVDAHLELGRAYFDLDLGDDALAEFRAVERLAPSRPEGYVLSSLEYIYRGEYATALSTWTRARALSPSLPQLDDLLGSLPTK